MKANAIQGTQEWLQARCGKFTASRAADLMARIKSGPAASRTNLIARLVAERATATPVETYCNTAMERGITLEAEARDAYCFETGAIVHEVGFITYDQLPNTGASPDGLIGEDGLLEIKCPMAQGKHLAALQRDEHAKEYSWQLQHQLMVTQRQWVDIVSYDPRWPSHLQLVMRRIKRDEALIDELMRAIRVADAEVEEILHSLGKKEAA